MIRDSGQSSWRDCPAPPGNTVLLYLQYGKAISIARLSLAKWQHCFTFKMAGNLHGEIVPRHTAKLLTFKMARLPSRWRAINFHDAARVDTVSQYLATLFTFKMVGNFHY
jgi:hypothetical protein